MLKQESFQNNYRISDPDPVTLITLCFAGIGMGAGVAAAIMQGISLLRQLQEDKSREREFEAELFSEYEQLRIRIRNMNNTIREFRRNAKIAESFVDFSKKSNENQGKFLMGATVIRLSGNSLQIWNLLVDNIATDIRLMNRYVIESTESISKIYRLISSSSKYDRRSSPMLYDYMHDVYYEAEHFKDLLVSFP